MFSIYEVEACNSSDILTFGTNTKHNVAVVQNIMKTDIKIKTASRRSAKTNAIAAPIIHIIRTLYTLKPMCFESFNAGIDTCRVSHAKNAPKI